MSQNDGPRLVVVLEKDLFFSVKIGNELKAQGYAPVFARSTAQFATLLAEREPVLGLVDLGTGVDWEEIERLGESPATRDIPILAFGPHKDVEGRRAAKGAGVVRVISNSQFHAELPTLVARYARG